MIAKKTLIIALIGACAAAQAGIVNGSFEDPAISGWGLYSNITGWYADTLPTGGVEPIEIGNAGIYGVSGYDGLNILELDSNANSKVSQNVSGLVSGQTYQITFGYAKRAGDAANDDNFQVMWNDSPVQSFNPTSTAMTDYSFNVVAGGANKLSFLGTGTSDSYGGIIDNVRAGTVPEPCTMALMGAGVAVWVRRRRKSA